MTRSIFILILFTLPLMALKAQQPSPVIPSNRAVLSDTSVQMIWNPVIGTGITYQVQVSSDSLFSMLLADTSGLTDNRHTLSAGLGQTYWWRVRHWVSGVPQNWSVTFKFTTFSPSLLSGITIWLEADTGVILSGNQVQSWPNRLGSYTLAQGDPAKRPLFTDTALFKKPALVFDGSNDFLEGPFLNYSSISVIAFHNPLNKNSSLFSQARFTYTGFNWSISNTSRPTVTCLQTPSNLGYTFSGHTYPFAIPSSNLSIDGMSLSAGSHALYTMLSDSSGSQTIAFLDNPALTFARLGAMGNNSAYYKGNVFALIITNNTISKADYTKLYDYLTWKYQPPVNLGTDQHLGYSFCAAVLAPTHHYQAYQWSTGATTRTIHADTAGTYWLQATDYLGRITRDTIVVYGQKPAIVMNDTTICAGDTISIGSGISGSYTHMWNNNPLLNQPSLQVFSAGFTAVKVTDTLGCFLTDSVLVTIDHYNTTASLGPDRSVCMGEAVALVSGAAQTVSYQWSSGVNDTLPEILIVSPGSYTLTSVNFRGCIAVSQITITMKGVSPIAAFQVSTKQGCLNDTIVFTDQSVSGPSDPLVQWFWNVGNNTTFTTQGPHQHSYNIPGHYPVSLKVTSDSGCFHTFRDTIVIHPLPLIGFTPLKGCTGTPIQFNYTPTGQSPAAFLWTFYSNAPNPDTSTLANPSYTWVDHGSHPVFLRVTSSLGCSNTDSLHVTLYQTPSPLITTNGNPNCAGFPISFIDTGLFNPSYPFNYWTWNFGDGSPAKLTTFNTITHPYTFAGSYHVTLTTGSLFTGCKDSADFQIVVNSTPKAVLHPANLCNGKAFTLTEASTVLNDTIASWVWDLEGKGLLYGKNPSVTYADTGNYTVSLIVRSGNGCLDTTESVIQVNPTPISSFTMNPLYGSPPLQVNFYNFSEGAITYSWDFNDGGSSTAFQPTYLFTKAGIYNVTLESESDKGCKATSSGTVFTMQPSMDLELTRTDGTVTGDRIRPVVEFRNNSSVEMHRAEIKVWLAGGSPIIETWEAKDYTDRLKPGAIRRYEFNASLLKDPHIPDLGDIICASAIIPEYPTDLVPENNHRCTALEKAFTVKSAWPNPARTSLTLDVIIDMPDDLSIDLYNIQGQKISALFNDYLERGLNRIVMEIPDQLPGGVYILTLVHRDHVMNQKIIVL